MGRIRPGRRVSLLTGTVVLTRVLLVDSWHACWPVAGSRKAMICNRRNRRNHIVCASSSGTGDNLDEELSQIDQGWEEALRAFEKRKENKNSEPEVEPERLRSTGMLYDAIRTQGFEKFPFPKRKKFANGSPINVDTYTKLQDILGDDFLDRNNDPTSASNHNESDENCIFLDADAYLEYSKMEMETGMGLMRNYDGRETKEPGVLSEQEIREFALSPEAPYKDFKLQSGKEPSFQDIINMKDVLANQKRPTEEEEREIYEQVFRTENAFMEQTSDLFREGLTNKTAAAEAAKQRRSSKYRKDLSAQLNKLEKQIQDFEKLVQEEEKKHKEKLRDAGMNSDESLDTKPLHQGHKPLNGTTKRSLQTEPGEDPTGQIQPEEIFDGIDEEEPNATFKMEGQWVLVDDPSTGESFYWNSETGEMRYDLDLDDLEGLDVHEE